MITRNIDKIIIHCSATREGESVNALEIDKWHKKKGWKGIGYHFLIDIDGKIEVGRNIRESGAHTKGENSNSIGVCYVGGVEKERDSNGDWVAKDTRTNEQKESILLLLQTLKKMFKDATIHGHNEFANKSCPCFDAKSEYNNLKTIKDDTIYYNALVGIINWFYGFFKSGNKPNTNR